MSVCFTKKGIDCPCGYEDGSEVEGGDGVS